MRGQRLPSRCGCHKCRPVQPDADTKEPRLYHLDNEIGEKTNLADSNPAMVKELTSLSEAIMAEIGGSKPAARRPAGKVEKPSFLYPSEGRGDAPKAKQPKSRKNSE